MDLPQPASQKIDERLYRVCVWVKKNITLMRLTALC
jgi:hypothetical protein